MSKGSYTLEQLKLSVEKSICWSDVCRNLNITICTFNVNKVRQMVNDNSIDISHFDYVKATRRNKKIWNDETLVYCENSMFPRASLRYRVIKDQFIEYKCSCCGIKEWNNKQITLEIEHINGMNTDHRKENLTWLCPNCHSQTPTFRNNKNRRKPGHWL